MRPDPATCGKEPPAVCGTCTGISRSYLVHISPTLAQTSLTPLPVSLLLHQRRCSKSSSRMQKTSTTRRAQASPLSPTSRSYLAHLLPASRSRFAHISPISTPCCAYLARSSCRRRRAARPADFQPRVCFASKSASFINSGATRSYLRSQRRCSCCGSGLPLAVTGRPAYMCTLLDTIL